MALHTLELCAGYGGIGLGLRLAGADPRTVCYVEREITVAGVLAARFEDGSLDPAPIWSDLKTFDGKPWRGRVDCVVAGYPCQPFSLAGKRLGRKDPRHLWPDVARIIRETEAPSVFLENVGGHLRLGFRQVAQELRRMGYRVAAGLFTAEEIGATHRRERLFILARRVEDSARLTGERERRRGRVSQAGNALAYAGSERSQIDGNGRYRETQRAPAAGTGRLFPPGPGDLDAWREVLKRTPEIEPAVCRSAHGLTPRVDRLRALGNGVVPQVAAHAWRTLRRYFE